MHLCKDAISSAQRSKVTRKPRNTMLIFVRTTLLSGAAISVQKRKGPKFNYESSPNGRETLRASTALLHFPFTWPIIAVRRKSWKEQRKVREKTADTDEIVQVWCVFTSYMSSAFYMLLRWRAVLAASMKRPPCTYFISSWKAFPLPHSMRAYIWNRSQRQIHLQQRKKY